MKEFRAFKTATGRAARDRELRIKAHTKPQKSCRYDGAQLTLADIPIGEQFCLHLRHMFKAAWTIYVVYFFLNFRAIPITVVMHLWIEEKGN